ncbi:MAG: zinc-binding dehydrogenase [Clostridia bacterium]|nr:zinc-binding dehydrogenase [Clostridia bacterium]
MKTKAVRIYGKEDLRLESFELPEIGEDEILAKVICDSICMSSYKAAMQGAEHKRVPNDVAENPTLIGHEFCSEVVKAGKKWENEFKPGTRFAVQPNINYKGTMWAPGYSYKYMGGDATYIVIPHEFMEEGCLLPYNADNYFGASLSEPLSCVAGTFKAMYHTRNGCYEHFMGIKEGGKMALLASVGPMGLAAIDYIIHTDRRPGLLTITDIDQARLDRAASIYTVEEAKRMGIELHYVNTGKTDDPVGALRALTGGTGYDDVVCFAPVTAVVEQADAILGRDGCLNFFAGPSRQDFYAKLNFYNVHYSSTHVCGTSGGNTEDMAECLRMMSEGRLTPAALVTHIGGIDAVIETTLNLPKIPGGKKLIYMHINLPLTAIDEFEEKGKTDPMFARLHELTQKTNGLWNREAEEYLLKTLAKEDQ